MASNSTNHTTDTETHSHPIEKPESDVKYWREGSDLVIERKKGPGDDVEVEVQKNVFTDCNRFEEAARHVKRYILEMLKSHREKKEALNGHGRPLKA